MVLVARVKVLTIIYCHAFVYNTLLSIVLLM